MHEIVQILRAFVLSGPSPEVAVELILGELINLRARGLLQSFPNPEFVVEALDLMHV